MTHEELLDAISVQIVNAPPFALGGYTRFLHALQAVIKLHTPATEGSFTNNDCICMLPGKKCATIQAIEKVLE